MLHAWFVEIADDSDQFEPSLDTLRERFHGILSSLRDTTVKAVHDVLISIVQLDGVYMEVRTTIIEHLETWLSDQDHLTLLLKLKDIIPIEKISKFESLVNFLVTIDKALTKATVGKLVIKASEISAPKKSSGMGLGTFFVLIAFVGLVGMYASYVYQGYAETGKVNYMPDLTEPKRLLNKVRGKEEEGYERLI